MTILERFQSQERFRPSTVGAFVALRLANRLEDPEHLSDYVAAAEEHSVDQILAILSRVVGAGGDAKRIATHLRDQFLSKLL